MQKSYNYNITTIFSCPSDSCTHFSHSKTQVVQHEKNRSCQQQKIPSLGDLLTSLPRRVSSVSWHLLIIFSSRSMFFSQGSFHLLRQLPHQYWLWHEVFTRHPASPPCLSLSPPLCLFSLPLFPCFSFPPYLLRISFPFLPTSLPTSSPAVLLLLTVSLILFLLSRS